MAYINKVSTTAAAAAVLFLAVTFAPQWTEAQARDKVDPMCLKVLDIVEICYLTLSLVPSEECCKNLKSASQTEVTCLCDNFIAHPSNANITRAMYDEINTGCGLLDKFACKGGDTNGGAKNKIAATMSLFGLVTSLFL